MSAFHLLNVSPESSRAEIDVAYEDAGFNDRAPESVLQKAVGALTAYKPRLYEEVSYWWGIPLHKIDEFTQPENPDTGKILACEAIKTMPLPALTKANIAAHLCENKSIANTNTFANRLNALIKEQKNIDPDDVGKMINHARKKSGVVPIAKSEHITTALIKLREEQHIKAAINMIFHAEHPGTLATNITDKWRFDKTASGSFVADLIRGAYKSRIQPILQPLEQDIDRAADILRDTPRNELSLQLIERKLSEWDEYAQPLQLIDEGKGFDEKRSSGICSKLRDLSLHLHNNEGESEISLRISKLLNKVFPELPETAEQLAHDLSALKNIVDEKHRDTKIKARLPALARLQALMSAVENIQNTSDIDRTLASIKNFDDLINAFSALLNEYPEVANKEDILWLIPRNAAITLHNKHNATYAALDLTKRLLTLANNFNAPQSVVDKLQQDKNHLQGISESLKASQTDSRKTYNRPTKLAQNLSELKIVGEKHRDTKIKVRLQAFIRAVENIQNASGILYIRRHKAPRDLINAFSVLLNEYPEAANKKEIWLIARSTARTFYSNTADREFSITNKHKAASAALDLIKRLLSLANNFNAPQSVVDKLQQDKNDFQDIIERWNEIKTDIIDKELQSLLQSLFWIFVAIVVLYWLAVG